MIGLFAAGGLLAGDLFRDDFARFPAGLLSRPVYAPNAIVLNGAIQEYHYLAHRGVDLAPWENPINHEDAWAASDEDGRPYLEMHAVNESRRRQYNPLLVTGDPEWFDYTVEADVRPLSAQDMAGLVFRYRHNRHFCLFALTGGNRAVLRVRLPLEKTFRVAEWRDLGSAEFAYDAKRFLRLKVENSGAKIRAYIDGRLVIEAEDNELPKGKAGLAANMPARFRDFRVSAEPAVEKEIARRAAAREAELAKLRAANPQPKLWRQFSTKGWGAGRNVRLGDLDGDGRPDLLFAQNIHKVDRDAWVAISCLTAVTLEGKILWQHGRCAPGNGLLTADTPFQIHDLDGDGKNEVVLVKDFQLQVWDGKTGARKKAVWLPEMKAGPYRHQPGDALAFADLKGRGRRGEIIVKDRYREFWVYSQDLEPLWSGTGLTGHFPYPLDADGDKREEFAMGYKLWGPDGRARWSYDERLRDHADGIVIGNFTADPAARPRIYACGSDEGYLMFSLEGELLKHVRIGHAQSPSVAKYREDVAGLQLMTINYWYNPGIVSLFDADGNLLEQAEPMHGGSPLLPVNWTGSGVEYALLSGSVRDGGMLDGRLRRVVTFPNDGHPDLASYVADVTGDARDEIILWDQERVWIYTQDRPFAGQKIYAPIRTPDHNESNYRTTVSLPGWRAAR
jgi:hypothetical protein